MIMRIPTRPAHIRLFSTSSAARSAAGSRIAGPIATESHWVPSKIVGNMDQDGLSRFDLDFTETCEWTKELLLKMKHDHALLKSFHKEYRPRNLKDGQVVCVETTHRFTYDFSKPQPKNSAVSLHARVSELGLSPKEHHKFLLLSGSDYDPYTDVVTLTRTEEDSAYVRKNIIAAHDILKRMIEESKNAQDTMEGVPLDFRHIKPKRIGLEFPKEWLKPANSEAAAPAEPKA
ncbi:mitochondrial ribosomal subunit protein-domain-containing protein [Polychytrium aggregatum]|uniref:mitochondrial ribosomal subunit protein-domain-containing protein n=1 Tax=Polychytrium aggregatum TaxID=110093 RepID=UPI0022FF11F8|nr:mitochondrial ribosomal subunit protein-domain-containing protein [Polychytrium aggregatum]KAI9203451.1 mitochondrial ribosomal subunit protein-domain-containing protein [Polychytrium aggregatum]